MALYVSLYFRYFVNAHKLFSKVVGLECNCCIAAYFAIILLGMSK